MCMSVLSSYKRLYFCCISDGITSELLVTYSGVVFFQAEDGIRDLVRSRGLGDVYKRQASNDGVFDEHTLDGCASRSSGFGNQIGLDTVSALSLIHI